MKNNRQELILSLIERQDVETQEQLLTLLEQKGIQTTQATISRDIKQLHIIKELSSSGNYRYRASVKPVEHAFNAQLNLIFKQ